jgi:hypothetical protein
VIPYRDFVFAHPAGIVLLLLPLSIIALVTGTRVFTGAARAQTACVAAGNVLLLAQLVRHRGTLAVVVAGFTLALFPLAVFADEMVMLEPYLVFFCLLGARAMFTGDEIADGRWLVWAGVAFGFRWGGQDMGDLSRAGSGRLLRAASSSADATANSRNVRRIRSAFVAVLRARATELCARRRSGPD